MRWAGHVARTGKRRSAYGLLVEKSKRKIHVEDPGVNRRMIWKWILKKLDVTMWTGTSWLRIGTSGFCL
jgi:hypothetical protein